MRSKREPRSTNEQGLETGRDLKLEPGSRCLGI